MINSIYYYAASALFNGVLALFLVYYIYLRNKKNPLNRSFLYFGIAVGGWCIFYALWGWASTPAEAERYIRLHMMFASFIPATFFRFITYYTENQTRYRRLNIFFLLLGAAYSAACPTSLMVSGIHKVMFFEYWGIPGRLLLSHVVYFAVVVLWALVLLVRYLLNVSGYQRKQCRWILAAFLIGFGGGVTNWFIWFQIPILPVTHFFVGITFILLAYTMVRYGLMDTDMLVEVMRNSRALSLGLMAAGISHELRNPLFLARGQIEAYLDKIDRNAWTDPAVREKAGIEAMRHVYTHLNRASDIMQRLSAFGRPRQNRGAREPVDLEVVITSVLEFVKAEQKLQNITVHKNRLTGIRLDADRGHLEEIFFNLILNACQVMETGGVLTIETQKIKGRLCVIIADTGGGIPSVNLPKIFDPFYTDKTGGSGLGLYIAKLMAEKNNAEIKVKSDAGKGTTFSVEFKAESLS